MKKNERKKIGLGIFVIVGILFFILAIYYVGKKQQLFNSTFHVSGFFRDVRGLQVGNNVRFSGINVGIVENIAIISDSAVQVDLLIDEETRRFIHKNASAVIGSDGLMGNKILTLMPGTPGEDVIRDNDYIRTHDPINMDDIFAKLKITGDNAATITGDLAAIIGNIRSGKGTIGKLFMDSTFATTLDRTVVNLNEGASGFSDNMEAAKKSFLLKGLFRKKKKEEKKPGEEEKKPRGRN